MMRNPGWLARIKAGLHPQLDPLLSLPSYLHARLRLARLRDGTYQAGVTVPYYAQFASPELISEYIHNGFDGTTDPLWHTFGAQEPSDYAFWAPRVCALTVLKMAIEAFTNHRPTLWQLVREGLALNGYTMRDGHGNWIDQGWYVDAQVQLAQQYGLLAEPFGYVSSLAICSRILEGGLIAATVTPEIGERTPASGRYGGHLVLVYGFEWRRKRPTHFLLHNPSGRFEELRAHARLTAARFNASFAHRIIVLNPLSVPSAA